MNIRCQDVSLLKMLSKRMDRAASQRRETSLALCNPKVVGDRSKDKLRNAVQVDL